MNAKNNRNYKKRIVASFSRELQAMWNCDFSEMIKQEEDKNENMQKWTETNDYVRRVNPVNKTKKCTLYANVKRFRGLKICFAKYLKSLWVTRRYFVERGTFVRKLCLRFITRPHVITGKSRERIRAKYLHRNLWWMHTYNEWLTCRTALAYDTATRNALWISFMNDMNWPLKRHISGQVIRTCNVYECI